MKGYFPNLAIGGPAVGWNEAWAKRFVEYAAAHRVPLDFFSWHGYDTEPRQVAARAARMRTLLDTNGYTATESNLTEWNYVRGWSGEWVYSMRAESGDRQELGAAFTAAVFTELQASSVTLAHYYDARPGTSMNGLFNATTARPTRFYFPFWRPAGDITFPSAMGRVGMKLSLWLCCKYDLFRYEEECAAGAFTLHEDDGMSLDYRKGGFARTPVAVRPNADGTATFTVGRRTGSFAGMPKDRRMKARFHFSSGVVEKDLGPVGEAGVSVTVPLE